MLTVKNITDKSLNLDIQGQRCGDDYSITVYSESRGGIRRCDTINHIPFA